MHWSINQVVGAAFIPPGDPTPPSSHTPVILRVVGAAPPRGPPSPGNPIQPGASGCHGYGVAGGRTTDKADLPGTSDDASSCAAMSQASPSNSEANAK